MVGLIHIFLLIFGYFLIILFVVISILRLIKKRRVKKGYSKPLILSEKPHNDLDLIPEILHRIWIGPRVFPPYKDLRWMQSFDRVNDTFTRVVWKDQDVRQLIERRYPEYEATYSGYRLNIQRADLARYIVLYEYGGMYADLDLSSARPVSELLSLHHDKRFFCFVEIVLSEDRAHDIGEAQPIRKIGKQKGFGDIPEDQERIASYLILCSPKHPMMGEILKEIKRRAVLPVKRQYDVFYTTGPDLFTSVVHRNLNNNPDVIVVDKGTSDRFFIHHGSATWKTFINFPFR